MASGPSFFQDGSPMKIILASGSPRRSTLLRSAAVRIEIVKPDVSEEADVAATSSDGLAATGTEIAARRSSEVLLSDVR